MFALVQILLKQKLRKQNRQYGTALALTMAVLLMLILLKLSSVFAHVLALPQIHFPAAFQSLWIGWVAIGILIGRDFTWHIRFERLMPFRQPFWKLYLLDLFLGLIAYPMLVLLGVFAVYGTRTRWDGPHWAVALASLLCFIWSARLTVSITRTIFFRHEALTQPQRLAGSVVLVAIAIAMFAMQMFPIVAPVMPGYALAAAAVEGRVAGAIWLIVDFVLLAVLDFWLQRSAVRSGVAASSWIRSPRLGSQFILGGSPLWRINMLGWLRNSNVLLLFLWGVSYGFLYTYLRHVSGTSYFLLFALIMLVFHSYARGNLFGIDHQGVWLYYGAAIDPGRVIRAKNAGLSLLQAIMIAAVVLPAVLRSTPGMNRPIEWACVIGFAVSGIVLGEIIGPVFSILHPEAIERGSMYSGGTTLGAFVIPAAELLLAILFLTVQALVPKSLPEAAAWAVFVLVPAFLVLVRWRALPVIASTLMNRHKEDLLEKLGAVTP